MVMMSAGEFVVGAEAEARLSKTLLPRVTNDHLQQVAASCSPHTSCVVKTVSHKRCVPQAACCVHGVSLSLHLYTV